MRFVLVSTHIDQTTGYSKVGYNLLKQLSTLSPKIKTFHYGFQRRTGNVGSRKYPSGVLSYDAAANEDPKEEGFGTNKIHEYLEMVAPDVVMIYNDPLIVTRFIESMKHIKGTSPYKLWIYLDQVYHGINPQLAELMRTHADRIYCFTDLWKERFLTNYGTHDDVRVLEHAVDPTVYSTMSPDAIASIRTNLQIPSDACVFLNANRNSQRKRQDLTIGGFARLLAKYPTKSMYLLIVTGMDPRTGAFYDMQRVFQEELKLVNLDLATYARRLLIIDTSANLLSDEAINQLYNVADIGINTSDGEGFGLCQLEHLYTGAPQVVTDVGDYRSFLDNTNSSFITADGRSYFTGGMPHGLWAATFSMDDVCVAMDECMTTIAEKRLAIRSYAFRSWVKVCDNFLEDVLKEDEARVPIVSAPATA